MEHPSSKEEKEIEGGEQASLLLETSPQNIDPRLLGDSPPTHYDVPAWFGLSQKENPEVTDGRELCIYDNRQKEKYLTDQTEGEKCEISGEIGHGYDNLPSLENYSFKTKRSTLNHQRIAESENTESKDDLMGLSGTIEECPIPSSRNLLPSRSLEDSHEFEKVLEFEESSELEDSPEPEDSFDPDHPLMEGVIYIKLTESPPRARPRTASCVMRIREVQRVERIYPPSPLRICRTMMRVDETDICES